MNRILDDMENCSWMANEDPTKPDSTGECHKKRKRIYRRRVNPPYSYVAMIALALQNAPERKLKLPQIFSEISTLFPFFKGDHWGWKDTVRHNLSCNDCFRKVPKDPLKPQAKGNYWTVDLSRIPEEAMTLKTAAIGQHDDYPNDLTPYILHGKPYSPLAFHHPNSTENILNVQSYSPLDSHHPHSTENTEFTAEAEDLSLVPSQPPCIDPATSFPMILWNLPTSYSKCMAPNVVAPPSIHPLLIYSNFPTLSMYNCMPSPSSSSTYAEQRDVYSTSLTPQMPPLPRPSEARYSSSDFPPNNMVFDIPTYPPHGGYMPPQNVYGQNLSQGEVYSGYRPNGY